MFADASSSYSFEWSNQDLMMIEVREGTWSKALDYRESEAACDRSRWAAVPCRQAFSVYSLYQVDALYSGSSGANGPASFRDIERYVDDHVFLAADHSPLS